MYVFRYCCYQAYGLKIAVKKPWVSKESKVFALTEQDRYTTLTASMCNMISPFRSQQLYAGERYAGEREAAEQRLDFVVPFGCLCAATIDPYTRKLKSILCCASQKWPSVPYTGKDRLVRAAHRSLMLCMTLGSPRWAVCCAQASAVSSNDS